MGEGQTAARVLARLTGMPTGTPVSGQQIAEDLGVSRNAVWKAVASLRQQGYVIDAEPRSGYRFVAAPDVIDPRQVLAAVGGDFCTGIRYLAETGSTNDVAKQKAKAGAPEGTVIVADRQTEGRGRRGRSWETAPGQALLVSIVLRPAIPPRQAPLLVFLAAAAVRSALLPYGETKIKWPNDVVTGDGRKLCGILVELDAEHDRVHHCIVGIGLNVNQRRHDFAEHLREGAGSVAEMAGRSVSRTELLTRLLDEFARRYREAMVSGFKDVLKEMRSHSATIGRAVVVHETAGDTWSGTAVDVRDDGALLVQSDADPEGWPVAVYAGEVSIRAEATINEIQ